MPLVRTVLEVAPSGLTAQAISSSQINLTWTANPRATSYRVYRSGVFLQSSSSPSLSVTGLSSSTSYSFTVSSFGTEEGPQSSLVSATTLSAADTIAPSVPGTPTVVALSATSLRVTWAGSTDTGGSGLAGYKLERSLNGSTWSQIVQPVSNTYDDTALSAFTPYYYRVRAYDGAANNSAYSATGSATTLASSTGTTWPLQSPTGLSVVPGLEGAATDTAGGFSSNTPTVILVDDSQVTLAAYPGGYTGLLRGPTVLAAAYTVTHPDTILVSIRSGTVNVGAAVKLGARTSFWGQFAPGQLIYRGMTLQAALTFGPPGTSATDWDIQHLDLRAGDDGVGDNTSEIVDGASVGGWSTSGAAAPTRIHFYKTGTGWTRDEVHDGFRGGGSLGYSNCIFYEPFDYSNHGDIPGVDPIDRHPFGPIFGGGYRWADVSIQRSVFAHMQDRQPWIAALSFNYVNNIIYNPGSSTAGNTSVGVHLSVDSGAAVQSTTPMKTNVVGNLFIAGPNTSTFYPVYMNPSTQQPAGSQGYIYGNAVFGLTAANQDALKGGAFVTGWSQISLTSAWKTGYGASLQGVRSIGAGVNPQSFTNAEMLAFATLVAASAGPRPFLRGSTDRAGVVAGHAVNRIAGSSPQGQVVNSVAGTSSTTLWPNTALRFAPNAGDWPTITPVTVDPFNPGTAWVYALPMNGTAPDNRILTSGTFADGQSKVGYRTLQAMAYDQDLYVTYGLMATATFDYYISPTGSDSNPGTLASPWAITAINTKQATYAGKRVGVMDGTYGLISILGQPETASGHSQRGRLKVAGGTVTNPTVIAAVNPCQAVIDWQLSLQTNSSANASMSVCGNYVTIDGLKFLNNNYQCIINLAAGGDGSGDHMTIKNCWFKDQHYTYGATSQNSNGIFVQNQNDLTYQNLLFENCNAPVDNGRYTHIQHFTPTARTLVEYCTAIANTDGVSANRSNSFVFFKVTGHVDVTVRYNYYEASHPSDEFLEDWGDNTTASYRNIHHNVFARPGSTGTDFFNLRNGSGVRGTWNVYNNTFLGAVTLDTAGFENLGLSTPVAVNVYDNIIRIAVQSSTYGVYDLPALSKLGTFDRNLYNSGATFKVSYNARASSLTGFATWQSTSGKDANAVNSAQATSSLFTLTGSGAAKYQLKVGSNAIGAGTSGGDIGAWHSGVTRIGYDSTVRM